uniref:Permease drug/metabolite transporter (DMT) superfamily n=1 Tax=uncultured marine crenarchaeote AD1000-325-A12 TaxID=526639 RepID=B3V5Q4_9ARCH|nr:permease drug/metabolite transporter (DMT) superfamily [uncultured marine crenarchaeote AD1000-325-A12]
MNSKQLGIIEIIIATLIWGTLGIIIKSIEMEPASIVAYRSLIAVPIMIFLLRKKVHLIKNKKKEKKKGNFMLLVLSGIAITLAWTAHFSAFKLTSIANTVILLYTGPVYVAVLSPLLLKEVREKRANICLILSVLGMLLIYNQGLGNELNNKGLLFGALSGILFAFVIISTKKLSKYYSSITIVGTQIIISAIILSPELVVEREVIINNIILLLTLGIIHTAIAEFLYIDGLIKISAQKASTISYIEPASAIIYAIILFNEIPQGLEIVGITLIALSNLILNIKSKDILEIIKR